MAAGGLFEALLEEVRQHRRQATSLVVGAAVAASAVAWYVRWSTRRGRELRRPFVIRDLADGETAEDPEGEITQIVNWLQDTLMRPLDARLPGRPFEYDLLSFPFTPLVMVVGNHSAGKSTFINRLLGVSVQETGVAPTDDGFTVLQRHVGHNEVEDGPTLLGCPENRPFKELQRFGPAFWRHLRRKRLVLPEDSVMPYGLQIVDTPGMIDMPVQASGQHQVVGGRGYNFLEVVRWFAQRADLILLLFDPDRPGTTGESLDVLTQSLAGLDHKFLIVLNKVDQLDSSVDFARAYGTLGWALSKVIPRKDIPQIYTMYNAGVDETHHSDKQHKLPLEAFRKKREEVVQEVLRTKFRHWDNVITTTEETLRELAMVCTVSSAVRNAVCLRSFEVQASSSMVLGLPGLLAAWVLHGPASKRLSTPAWAAPIFWAGYAFVCWGAGCLLREYCRQFERLQLVNLDGYFEEAYAWFFIHTDAEDLRARWGTVRSRTASILRAVSSVSKLPSIAAWEVERISGCLEKDIWYLRQLAKMIRKSAK